MPKKKHLGDFEFMVLAALARLGEPGYGMQVRQEIERRTGRETSIGAVHATLDRMEAKGYLTSTVGDPTPERGGKARRYFRVEAAGADALTESVEAMRSMLTDLDLSALG